MTPIPNRPEYQNTSSGPAETILRFETQFREYSLSSKKLFDYADAMRRVGRRNDAIKAYHTLDNLAVPESKRWLIALFRGQTFYDMGKYLDAEIAFREACKLEKGTVPRVYLAGSLAAQERFNDAVGILAEAMEYPGDHDEVLLNMALNQRTLGLLVEAKLSLEKALSLRPDYTEDKDVLIDIDAALKCFRPN